MSPPTLTTIPPELLLAIISHLTSANSLYALSQTSRSLASFLQTHAATVCNTHIQRHYNHAASILLSEFVDGWLVPKHHCILEAEERWFSERSSRASSLAPNNRGINMNNCCFRTPSVTSSDAIPPRPQRTPQHTQTMTSNRIQSPPNSQISPTSASYRPLLVSHTHHQDISLSLILGLPLRLSRPGPHYLSFLERYSSEIIARQVMYSPIENVSRASVNATSPHELHLDREKSSRHFDFMIGNYCVRKWLARCEEVFEDRLPELELVERRSRFKVVREKISIALSNGRDRFVSLKSCMSRTRKDRKDKNCSPGPRMLFGEIDSEDEKFGDNIEKDDWAKGLLWFYGISSQLAANSPSFKERASLNEAGQLKRCVMAARRTLRRKATLIRPEVQNAWSKIRCRGRFEILAD